MLDHSGEPIPGLYAVGETAGFGGGGIHGKGSLEGTFLGSCVLTGRLGGPRHRWSHGVSETPLGGDRRLRHGGSELVRRFSEAEADGLCAAAGSVLSRRCDGACTPGAG